MRASIRPSWPMALLFALGARAPALSAQVAPDCTYDACALRVNYNPAGAALVRGRDQVVVNGLGFWANDMTRVFAGNRLSQDLADSYRLRHNTGTALTAGGTVFFLAGLLASDGNISLDLDAKSLFTLGGLALIAVGTRVSVSGDDQLSRAIWEYNRTLPR